MGETSVNKPKLINLKLMVDTKAKKVVFAEAGKDFVDFIFGILTLPLSSVVKLLNEEGTMSSLRALYKSVESFKTDYFIYNVDKERVLKPHFHMKTHPLLPLDDAPMSLMLFKCPHDDCVSYRRGDICPNHSVQMRKMLSYVGPTAGYVKGMVPYMVADNLEVQPMSITAIKSRVSDLDFLEEQEVQFGLKEGLALLKASLATTDVLTTVFLRNNDKGKASS